MLFDLPVGCATNLFYGFYDRPLTATAKQAYGLVFELLGSLLSLLCILVTQFFYRILSPKPNLWSICVLHLSCDQLNQSCSTKCKITPAQLLPH